MLCRLPDWPHCIKESLCQTWQSDYSYDFLQSIYLTFFVPCQTFWRQQRLSRDIINASTLLLPAVSTMEFLVVINWLFTRLGLLLSFLFCVCRYQKLTQETDESKQKNKDVIDYIKANRELSSMDIVKSIGMLLWIAFAVILADLTFLISCY